MDILTASVTIAGVAIGLGTIGTAIGQGLAINGAMQGIARQPEASGTLQTNLIIGLAFIESLCIYALVISLLLLFANPFAKADKDIGEARAKVELVKAETALLQAQAQLDALKKNVQPAQ
jgi:F-type H+-transporting ATPase subunit c